MLSPEIIELLKRGHGVLHRQHMLAAGADMGPVDTLVRLGELTRVARGHYVEARLWSDLDEWRRFALRGWAFAVANDACLTGWAATVLNGLPTLGKPPAEPTAIVSRRGSSCVSARQRGLLHVARIPARFIVRRGHLHMTSAAWSVAEVARTSRLPDSLVVADAALRQGIELASVFPHMARWAGVRKLRWVAERADRAAESPLETLGRFGFYEHNLPLPVVNAWIGRDGPERRVDGLLPWHGWAWEGDGALKYDSDAAQVVRDQNEREFRLRRLGLDFARFRWSDVYPHREPFIAKVNAMFHDYRVRDRPVRYWTDVPGQPRPVLATEKDWPSPYPTSLILPAGWQNDARDGGTR